MKFLGLSFVGISITIATIEIENNGTVTGKLEITNGKKFTDLPNFNGSKIVVNDETTRSIVVKYHDLDCLVFTPETTISEFPRLIESLQSETLKCVDEKSNKIASKAILNYTENNRINGDFQALLNAYTKAFHITKATYNNSRFMPYGVF